MADLIWLAWVLTFLFAWGFFFGYALWAREYLLCCEWQIRELRREFRGRP